MVMVWLKLQTSVPLRQNTQCGAAPEGSTNLLLSESLCSWVKPCPDACVADVCFQIFSNELCLTAYSLLVTVWLDRNSAVVSTSFLNILQRPCFRLAPRLPSRVQLHPLLLTPLGCSAQRFGREVPVEKTDAHGKQTSEMLSRQTTGSQINSRGNTQTRGTAVTHSAAAFRAPR